MKIKVVKKGAKAKPTHYCPFLIDAPPEPELR
jgi:hypothetical protein